jgi:hypothetical protein
LTAQRRQPPTPALDTLAGDERAIVLAHLLASYPDLLPEAEQLALAVLGTDTIEGVADDIDWALDAIELEDLAARSGRVRGRAYVHETEAAWELLTVALDPYVADLRRRAMLGLVDSASVIATGIMAGLYRSRAPEDGTVVAYAGPDAIAELADQSLRDARELGVEIPSDAAEGYWPEWA